MYIIIEIGFSGLVTVDKFLVIILANTNVKAKIYQWQLLTIIKIANLCGLNGHYKEILLYLLHSRSES